MKTMLDLLVSNAARMIESRQYTELAINPSFSLRDFKAVPEKYRALVTEYIKDYVQLNQFAA